MYVVQSPDITPELAQRARHAARGCRQQEWTWWMLGPGFDASFEGRWANQAWKAFVRCRTRLAQAGIKTEALSLGYDGRPLYFVTGELHPAETLLWECSWLNAYERDRCVSALNAAGLMDLDWMRRAILLLDRGVAWKEVIDVLGQDGRPLDEPIANLTVELMRSGLTLGQALDAARMATSL